MTDVDVPVDTSGLNEPTTGVHSFGGGSIVQRHLCSPAKFQASDRRPHGIQRWFADRWGEPTEHLLRMRPQDRSWPKAITEKVKHDRLAFTSASIILAVNDPRFRRMQFQAALCEPSLERFANALRLHLIPAMYQPAIRTPTPPRSGERPGHPEVKCVVHKEIGEDRAHHAPLWGPAASLDHCSILLHHRHCQPSFDVEQRPRARHMFLDGPQQKLVV